MSINLKNYFKNRFTNFIKYIKEHKRKIIIQYIIFLAVFFTFLFIDQITKSLVFKHGSVVQNTKLMGDVLFVKNPFYNEAMPNVAVSGPEYVTPETILPIRPENWKDYSIIGTRSIWHKGVTFLPSGVNINAIQAVSMIIFLLTLLVPLMSRSKVLIVTIAIISAGAMGNMLDRFIFAGYVKDLFYWPFLESKGTFNFADVSVIIGAASTVLVLIFEFIKDHFKSKKVKEESESETHTE